MTLPPAAGRSRPAPPPLRLPRPRRRPGGLIASLLLHAVILLLLFRFGVQLVLGGGDDRFGPRGGGGGAGGSVHIVDLPAAAAPAPAPVRQPAVQKVPPPDPAITLPPPTLKPLSMTVPPVVASVGTASDGTTGQGPGTGGGTGSGTGPGVGNDSGPGRGGNGAYLSRPSPRVVLLPAACARGSFTVVFSVAADGHVAHVTVDPQPKDGSCRRAMVDKMMGYEFTPARNRNGLAVADTVSVKMSR